VKNSKNVTSCQEQSSFDNEQSQGQGVRSTYLCSGYVLDYALPELPHSCKYENLHMKRFYSEFVIHSLPVVIQNPAIQWQCTSRRWTKQYLVKNIGDVKGIAWRCHPSLSEVELEMKVSVKYFFNKLFTACYYLADVPLTDTPLSKEIGLPEFIGQDWVRLTNMNYTYDTLFIGNEGTFTPLHYDIGGVHSYLYVIRGQKKVLLVHPSSRDTVLDEIGTGSVWPNSPYPWKRVLTSLPEGHVFCATLNSRCGIFIPAGWLHAVVNTQSPTIMWGTAWVNHTNLSFSAKCSILNYGLPFSWTSFIEQLYQRSKLTDDPVIKLAMIGALKIYSPTKKTHQILVQLENQL
jgi:hypothetical protein